MRNKQRHRYAARLVSLADLTKQVGEYALAWGLGEQRLPGLELALEEAFVNICRHAYPDDNGEVEVGCSLENGSFVVELTDYGQPFDSSSRAEPQLDQSLTDRQPGGLGLFLIQKMTDDCSYQRQDQSNTLKLVFNLPDRGG